MLEIRLGSFFIFCNTPGIETGHYYNGVRNAYQPVSPVDYVRSAFLLYVTPDPGYKGMLLKERGLGK